MPKDAALRPVFADPAAGGEAFRRAHGFVPINHLVTVRRDLAESEPALLRELVRMFKASRDAAARADLPFGRAALLPALNVIIRYAAAQGLLPRSLDIAEVWEGLPPDIA
jgi:4,5-dihydroxyphthalate decarboxylase